MKLNVPKHDSLFVPQQGSEHEEILALFDNSTLLNSFYRKASSRKLQNLCRKPAKNERKERNEKSSSQINTQVSQPNLLNHTDRNQDSINKRRNSDFQHDNQKIKLDLNAIPSNQEGNIVNNSNDNNEYYSARTHSELSSLFSHSNPNSARLQINPNNKKKLRPHTASNVPNRNQSIKRNKVSRSSTSHSFNLRQSYNAPQLDEYEYISDTQEDQNEYEPKHSTRPSTAKRYSVTSNGPNRRFSSQNNAYESELNGWANKTTQSLDMSTFSSRRLSKPTAEELGLLKMRRFSNKAYSKVLHTLSHSMQQNEEEEFAYVTREKDYGFESTLKSTTHKNVPKKRNSNPNIASWMHLYSAKNSIHNMHATPMHAELKKKIKNNNNNTIVHNYNKNHININNNIESNNINRNMRRNSSVEVNKRRPSTQQSMQNHTTTAALPRRRFSAHPQLRGANFSNSPPNHTPTSTSDSVRLSTIIQSVDQQHVASTSEVNRPPPLHLSLLKNKMVSSNPVSNKTQMDTNQRIVNNVSSNRTNIDSEQNKNNTTTIKNSNTITNINTNIIHSNDKIDSPAHDEPSPRIYSKDFDIRSYYEDID